jgi:hypothetical protein
VTYYHSRARRLLIESLARVVCPPRPDPAALAGAITGHVQDSMRAFLAPARAALIAGMHTYDQSSRLWPGSRGRPARELEGEAAADYFRGWWQSPLGLQREFARGVKGLICIAYFEQPEVKAALGYTPEAWIEVVAARRLALYSEDIERHRQAILAPDPLPERGSWS